VAFVGTEGHLGNFFLPSSAREIEEGAKAAVPDVIPTPTCTTKPGQ